MRRPTILFMNRVYPPVRGATGRVLKDLARSFAREGWHVTVIASGEKSGEERDEGGVRIIRVKGPERPRGVVSYMWVWLKMLIVALRIRRRDALVTMSDPPLMVAAGAIVSKFKGSHHINWCHDLYPDVMPALGMHIPDLLMSFFKVLRRKAMAQCEKVIVSGRCMAKYLVLDGIDAKKIAMIPNWPDLELTDPEMIDVNGVPYHEADLDIVRPFESQIKTDRRFRVLYAGNLGRAHPIDTVLDAAELLKNRNSDVEFIFVGDGARFDDLVQQRADRCLDNIRLLPYQPVSRLRELMESGDIHLITMNDDAAGFIVPSKLYAALAVARPCIFVGPEQSETAKVIHDFHTGVVVPQGDAERLTEAILLFRQDADAWITAHKGALQARDVFTPQGSIQAWIERAWAIVKEDLEG